MNAPHEETEHDERVHPLLRRGPMRFGGLLAAALLVELVWALTKRGGESGAFPSAAVSSVRDIGRTLFADYAFPFIVFFVMTVAAAEAAVGLAIVIGLFRHRESLDPDTFTSLKW